jgi:arylsulfatase
MLKYRYDVPFKFTGKLDKLTFKLVPMPAAELASKAELEPRAAPEPDPIDTAKR